MGREIFTGRAGGFIEKFGQTMNVVRGEWGFFAVLTGILGFVVYHFVSLLG